MIRGLKILFRWLLLLFFLFITGLLIGGFIFQDELLEIVQKKLNENIPGTMKYQSARLSLIRKFPMATVGFKEVFLIGPRTPRQATKQDTLAGFEKLFVQIHMLDLLKKKYAIHSLHADQGSLYLHTDEKGEPNYSYFFGKKQEGFSGFVELQSMRLTNCRLQISNLKKQLEVQARLKRLDLNGTFARDEYALNTRGSFHLHKMEREGVLFFRELPASINLDMLVQKKNIQIKSGTLRMGTMNFTFNGTLQRGDGLKAGLVFHAENASLQTLVKLLHKDHWVHKNFSGLSGTLAMQGKVEGRISPRENPHIQLDLNLTGGGFEIPEANTRFWELNISGNYDNGRNRAAHTTRVQVKELDARCNLGNISGSFTMVNLVKPQIKVKTKGKLDLESLDDLWIKRPSRVESLSGTGNFTISAAGALKEWKFPDLQALKAFQWNGQVDLESGMLKLALHTEPFTEIRGRIRLGDYQSFENLSFNLGDNDYRIKGRVDNLLDVLHGQGSLWMQIELISDYTNFALLLDRNKKEGVQKQGISWPEKVHIKCRADIKKFVYKEFNVDNFNIWFRYDPKRLQCYELSFNGMSGQMKGKGEIVVAEAGRVGINTDLVLKEIDIQELFTAFKDFGQKVIQKQHLRGKLTGDLKFFARTDTTFRLQKESLLAKADFVIRKGALIGFEPLEKLSAYIDISELQHVKFSKLENQIIIRNNIVVIPEMEIESSALDMTLSGNHPFDNMYHYRVKLLMSDIFFRKWKKERQTKEFPYIEETDVGKPAVFLSIQNTPEGAKISYDRKAAADHFKERMNEESRELRSILHEEFGMFKQDSITGLPDEPDAQGEHFIIEWEEEDEKSLKKTPGKKKNEPEFKIEWEESPDSTLISEAIY